MILTYKFRTATLDNKSTKVKDLIPKIQAE